MSLAQYFSERDDEMPAFRKRVVRHAVTRWVGGRWRIEVSSSCGPRNHDLKLVPGTAKIVLYDKQAITEDNPTGRIDTKRFAADGWDEVEAELTRLIALLRPITLRDAAPKPAFLGLFTEQHTARLAQLCRKLSRSS